VACGRVDGFWEHGLAPWDRAAGGLIAAEAGATVGLLGQTMLATSPALFERVAALVAAGSGDFPAG
jgi:myo-inositol-1(or 4)-monophosphatase